MKKILLFLIVCLAPITSQAGCFWPEFKVSYYRFNSSLLRDIYGSGAAFYQGELNYGVSKNIAVFADVGYFCTKGHSLGFCQKTEMDVIPWTFGAKYLVPFGCGTAYLGGGVRMMSVDIHNDSNYVQRDVSRTSVGGVISGGFNFCWNRLLFTPFVEYNFNKMDFCANKEDQARNISRHDLDLSGWAFGAGVGYAF